LFFFGIDLASKPQRRQLCHWILFIEGQTPWVTPITQPESMDPHFPPTLLLELHIPWLPSALAAF